MKTFEDILNTLNSIIWGEYLLIPLLSIVGIYLTFGLRAMPWLYIGKAFKLLYAGRKPGEDTEGDITPFQALMTALSATIGTGNIAGVATAIYFGGPGGIGIMNATGKKLGRIVHGSNASTDMRLAATTGKRCISPPATS